MNLAVALERCRSFIDCQWQTKRQPPIATHTLRQGPTVTMCRETGSGALSVAEALAEYLQARDATAHSLWTVFDQNLVEKVIEEHNLPRQFAHFMSEERRSYIQDTMEELLGLHPASWTLAHKTMETILHLAQLGHVILVGRGANIITGKMPAAFHVRLVSPLEQRIEHVQSFYKLSRKEAADFIHKEDRGRARYIKEHFHCDIEDPLLYHLVINAGRVPHREAARVIGDAALRHFQACAAAHREEGQ